MSARVEGLMTGLRAHLSSRAADEQHGGRAGSQHLHLQLRDPVGWHLQPQPACIIASQKLFWLGFFLAKQAEPISKSVAAMPKHYSHPTCARGPRSSSTKEVTRLPLELTRARIWKGHVFFSSTASKKSPPLPPSATSGSASVAPIRGFSLTPDTDSAASVVPTAGMAMPRVCMNDSAGSLPPGAKLPPPERARDRRFSSASMSGDRKPIPGSSPAGRPEPAARPSLPGLGRSAVPCAPAVVLEPVLACSRATSNRASAGALTAVKHSPFKMVLRESLPVSCPTLAAAVGLSPAVELPSRRTPHSTGSAAAGGASGAAGAAAADTPDVGQSPGRGYDADATFAVTVACRLDPVEGEDRKGLQILSFKPFNWALYHKSGFTSQQRFNWTHSCTHGAPKPLLEQPRPTSDC